jgi:hypothetical protein
MWEMNAHRQQQLIIRFVNVRKKKVGHKKNLIDATRFNEFKKEIGSSGDGTSEKIHNMKAYPAGSQGMQ